MAKSMDRHESYYRNALLYDAQCGYPSVDNISTASDTQFYLAEAGLVAGPLLELGCGTGRITLALAGAGKTIVALDNSQEMIRLAQEKVPPGSDLAITFIQGDMRNFVLAQQFDLILIPFNTVHHLYCSSDIRRCLQSVRRHLTPTGRLAFDCLGPSIKFLANPRTEFVQNRQYEDKKTGKMVLIFERNVYDAATQILENEFLYDFGDKTYTYRVDKKIHFPQELDAHLDYNGFRVIAKYGDFDRSELSSASPKQVFICTKREPAD